jgi:hypothetical protein
MELCDQFAGVHIRKPPCFANAYVGTVCKNELHCFVGYAIFRDELCDTYPRQWTKEPVQTPEQGTEKNRVQVIAGTYFEEQQLISLTFSTYR